MATWPRGKQRQRDLPLDRQPKVVLLEHDDRFAVFPEFVYYDYQQPLKLPGMVSASPPSQSMLRVSTSTSRPFRA